MVIKNNPNDAILIKDDYERYYKAHKQFLSALTGDLISKTFLFVGFSFQDPNLDYILSRIRVDYEENPRQHYAIMKSLIEKIMNQMQIMIMQKEEMTFF